MNSRKHGKPAMPKQTSGPMSLILSHEIMKLRTFTNLNKRSVKVHSPKKVTITIWAPQNRHGTGCPLTLPRRKTIPNTPNHDTPKQSLVSFPDMRRVKKLQGAMYIWQRPAPKTFRPQRSAATLLLQASRIAALTCCTGPANLISRGRPAESKQELEDPT